MLCIIQTRMSSTRLPGKMLMDINGRPLLGRVIDRVKAAKEVTKLIVATSINKEDDAIEGFCKKEKINYYRGDLNNVYRRFKEIVVKEKAVHFIRINGDSPLMDPEIINFAVRRYKEENCDLLTNIFPRTYPKGQSVEVISSKIFIKFEETKLTADQKEHVTKYFYDNAKIFLIKNFVSRVNYSHVNLCVDTLNDLKRIRGIFSRTDSNQKNWEEISKCFI